MGNGDICLSSEYKISSMKRLIFVLLIMFCGVSHAQWVLCGSSKNGDFDFFIRAGSIKVEADRRTALVLFNYSLVTDGVKSSVALNEYDCSSKEVRTNYLIQYTKEMATGDVMLATAPPKDKDYWRPANDGSVTASIMKIVCSHDGQLPILRS